MDGREGARGGVVAVEVPGVVVAVAAVVMSSLLLSLLLLGHGGGDEHGGFAALASLASVVYADGDGADDDDDTDGDEDPDPGVGGGGEELVGTGAEVVGHGGWWARSGPQRRVGVGYDEVPRRRWAEGEVGRSRGWSVVWMVRGIVLLSRLSSGSRARAHVV